MPRKLSHLSEATTTTTTKPTEATGSVVNTSFTLFSEPKTSLRLAPEETNSKGTSSSLQSTGSVSRLFSLFSLCRNPCWFEADQISFEHGFAAEPERRPAVEVTPPPEHRCDPQPNTEQLVNLVTSAVLAVLEERELLSSNLKASFRTDDPPPLTDSVSPLAVSPLTDSVSPLAVSPPHLPSCKSEEEEDPPLFTAAPPSPTDQVANVIFRLVTEVSTDLSPDDKTRIQAKFGSPRPMRSLSISGSQPRAKPTRVSARVSA